MKDIIRILMERDDCTEEEAIRQIRYCKRRLHEEAVATGDYVAAEEIVAEELGLEPDYLISLLL